MPHSDPALPSPPVIQRYLEVHEVAYHLRRSQETIRRLIRHGQLAAHRVGGAYLVDPVDLQAFLDRQRVASQGNGAGNGHA